LQLNIVARIIPKNKKKKRSEEKIASDKNVFLKKIKNGMNFEMSYTKQFKIVGS